MTTDPIKALVERLRNCRCVESTNVEDVASYVRENYAIRHEAAAAIEALKPLADGTHVVVVEKVRKILEEIETETNRATREFHGNSYSAAFAHNRASAALAAINGEK